VLTQGDASVNKWKIPDWLESEIRDRDRRCVYCHRELDSADAARPSRATWEHIVNDATLISRENIARCCASCNSSKGTKVLAEWLTSAYGRSCITSRSEKAGLVG
jgi:5-methylcytosine-specific restriction endonuclease McrA